MAGVLDVDLRTETYLKFGDEMIQHVPAELIQQAEASRFLFFGEAAIDRSLRVTCLKDLSGSHKGVWSARGF